MKKFRGKYKLVNKRDCYYCFRTENGKGIPEFDIGSFGSYSKKAYYAMKEYVSSVLGEPTKTHERDEGFLSDFGSCCWDDERLILRWYLQDPKAGYLECNLIIEKILEEVG